MQEVCAHVRRQGLLADGGIKMVVYKCIECQKEVQHELVRKRVRCPFCGSKILYKPRVTSAIVDAV